MKQKFFSTFSFNLIFFSAAFLFLAGISSNDVMAQGGVSFTIKKDVCDALGSQNSCTQGNNNELDGQTVKFTIALNSTPTTIIETVNVPINNGSGAASPTTNFTNGLELRVCEIDVPMFFDATPQPERSTGGSSFRAEGDCIIFTEANGNQQLQFANVRDDLSPTAAPAMISGRVLDSKGRGVSRAKVVLTDSNGVTRMYITNPFGFYRFEEVTSGETYIIGGFHKRYNFAPRVLNLIDSLTDQDLIAQ